MAEQAVGTFELTGWEEKTEEELADGAKLTRAVIRQRFTGDLDGEGTWDALMFYRADGTASFAGFQRISGKLGGNAGSFVLRTMGTYDGKEARSSWSVLPGSGSGRLRRLRGEGTSAAPHGPAGTYTLEYELE